MSGTTLSDTWERGSPYEQYVGRWSRRIAPIFLEWLALPRGLRWLDLGCGTGALCAAVLDAFQPISVTGVEPSEGFLTTARANLAGRVFLLRGDASAIPMGDESVDAAVSGLVLNFVPDARAALAEMARVTARGGTIAAYVWDYAEGMQLMRRFWDAAVALQPQAVALDEGPRFPLCHPEALRTVFVDAGLHDVDVTAVEIPTPFDSFADYWQPFLGGQGPAPAYAMSLDEGARVALRERLRSDLPTAADGSIALTARAWAVRATV
jgi:SAM-dependent methyltransferase